MGKESLGHEEQQGARCAGTGASFAKRGSVWSARCTWTGETVGEKKLRAEAIWATAIDDRRRHLLHREQAEKFKVIGICDRD